MDRAVRTPGPDHPIDIRRAGQGLRALCEGVEIARSDNALILSESRLPDVVYFPRADVALGALEKSATSSWCPYKGEASYFSLCAHGPDGGMADIGWSYEAPLPAMREIAGHVAFYARKVAVEPVGP